MRLHKDSSSATISEWDILGEEDWDVEKILPLLDSAPIENLNSDNLLHTPQPPSQYENNIDDMPQNLSTDPSSVLLWTEVPPRPPDEIFDSPSTSSLSENSTQRPIYTLSNTPCPSKSLLPLNDTIPVKHSLQGKPPQYSSRPNPTTNTHNKAGVTGGYTRLSASYSDQLMTPHEKPAVLLTKIQDEDAVAQPSPDSESESHSQLLPPSQVPQGSQLPSQSQVPQGSQELSPSQVSQGSQLLPTNVTQAMGVTSDGFTLTTFTMPKQFMMYQVPQSVQNSLPTVIMPKPSVSTSSGVPPTASTSSGGMLDIPILSDMEGEYGFTVTVEEKERTLKSPMWLMSPVTRKLYTNINKAVPFEVHLSKPPADIYNLCVKAVPVFSSPQFLRTNVTRCPNHSAPTDPTNHDFPYPEYVVRADHPEAQYLKGPSGRLAVIVPLDHLQNGPTYTPILLRFMCLGSCVGGINRRPIAIVLTLENQQEVLGRKVIDVRVCACPTRDIKTDELAARGTKRKGSLGQINQQVKEQTSRKKPKICEPKTEADDDDQYYTIKVRGSKLYNFMMGMKELYYVTHPEYALQYFDPSTPQIPSGPSPKRDMKFRDIRPQRESTEEVISESWEMQTASPSNEHLEEPQKDPLDITEETNSSRSVGPQMKLYVVDNQVERETSTGNSEVKTTSQAGLITPSCANVIRSSPPVNSSPASSQSTVLLSRHIPVMPVTTYKPSFRRVSSEPKFSGIRQSAALSRTSTRLVQGQKLGEVSPVREGSVSPASKEMLAAKVLIGGFHQDGS